jgi:putative membrane protein
MQRLTLTAAIIACAALGTLGGTTRAHAQAPTAKLDDPTIVAIFDAANSWDMETGGLGAQKGGTQAVRDYGAMIRRDHEAVRQQGRDLAVKLHVTPTPPGKDFALYQDHVTAVATLTTATGPAFDRAFLEHEVSYHKAVIDAVNTTLLPSLQNADVKALVVKVAPAFQAHMIAAQRLLDEMGKGTVGN